MNDKNEHGERFVRLFPSPHYGFVGSGTIIGIDYDEALRMKKEDEEIKITRDNTE